MGVLRVKKLLTAETAEKIRRDYRETARVL